MILAALHQDVIPDLEDEEEEPSPEKDRPDGKAENDKESPFASW